jgi:hypothetical protein
MIEKLSIKQKQFCDAYLTNNGNATAAAISAGYSKSSAQQIGYENLKKQSIADYIGHLSNGNKPKAELKPEPERIILKWTVFKSEDSNTHPTHGQTVLAYDSVGESRVCRFNAKVDQKHDPFLISTFKTDNSHSFYSFAGELKRGDHKLKVCYDDIDMLSDEIDIVMNKLEQELYKHVMSHRPYFTGVIAWMPLPEPAHTINNLGDILLNENLNDEYLIEQTTLETFDIIDAITPALREAVKHLLVQQGVSK